MKRIILIIICSFSALQLNAGDPPAKEMLLFDFEDPADLKAWSNVVGAKDKEPPIKLELSNEHATWGKHSLKLTFAGGNWPTIATTNIQGEWLPFKTFQADVTVSRPCLVGFTILQEKSHRGEGWEALISRWTKTAFLQKGKNRVTASLPQPNDYALAAKWGKVVRFEVFMYAPHEGESIFIDNIRLSMAKEAPPAKREFTVAGTDWVVSGTSSAQAVIELGKKLKAGWKSPVAKTLVQIEKEFRAQFAELKEKHPGAVLAILRDGEKGYDPDEPDKVYAGWKDAYFNSHGPDGNYLDRARNKGKSASHEIFMRHRSPVMRVDLSSIPTHSNILAAKLIVVRANDKILDDHNAFKKPTMWVVEPCNRPWHEYEVNAFEYAKDKFWKAVGGMHWEKDADFAPIFLAHGPGQGKVNAWDFTEAVRYWTSGKHPNHGFMLHGDSHDYMIGFSREAKNVRDRPAVLVVYVPK